jgi:ABC-type phosphate transport system substrate-binding protein
MRSQTLFRCLSSCVLLGLLISVNVHADIALVVHPDNPMASLSEKQAKRIFMGKMRLYPDTNQVIRVLDLPLDDPTREAFYRQLVSMDSTRLARYRASYLFSGKGALPEALPNADAVAADLREHSNAIGYLDAAVVPEGLRVLLLLKTED